MNRPLKPAHLVERAAELLRANGGATFSDPAEARAATPAAAPAGPPPGPPAGPPPGLPPGPVAAPQPGAAPEVEVSLAVLQAAGLVAGNARTRVKEEFRVTASRVLREMRTAKPGTGAGNLLLVTSAKPGEGKTFSALNLAGVIAETRSGEVLLIDTDAKALPLSSLLGLAERPGLLDLAADPTLRIEDMVVRTAIPGLSILPVGARARELNDASRPIAAVIERVARRLPRSTIVVDAPPCLSTSDPTTLAPFAGQVLMVVEAERTQRSEIAAALDLVKACPTVMLLLNKIRFTADHTFGAYDYTGTYT